MARQQKVKLHFRGEAEEILQSPRTGSGRSLLRRASTWDATPSLLRGHADDLRKRSMSGRGAQAPAQTYFQVPVFLVESAPSLETDFVAPSALDFPPEEPKELPEEMESNLPQTGHLDFSPSQAPPTSQASPPKSLIKSKSRSQFGIRERGDPSRHGFLSRIPWVRLKKRRASAPVADPALTNAMSPSSAMFTSSADTDPLTADIVRRNLTETAPVASVAGQHFEPDVSQMIGFPEVWVPKCAKTSAQDGFIPSRRGPQSEPGRLKASVAYPRLPRVDRAPSPEGSEGKHGDSLELLKSLAHDGGLIEKCRMPAGADIEETSGDIPVVLYESIPESSLRPPNYRQTYEFHQAEQGKRVMREKMTFL